MLLLWALTAGLLGVLLRRERKRREALEAGPTSKWMFLPMVADPAAPSEVELADGIDLSCFLEPTDLIFQYDPEQRDLELPSQVDVEDGEDWVTFIKRESAAEMVEGMCHWVQNRDMVQHRQMHVEFHLTDYCPYAAMAAVLRGEPDPRDQWRRSVLGASPCTGCNAPLRKDSRGLNTCDTDGCPGNLGGRT